MRPTGTSPRVPVDDKRIPPPRKRTRSAPRSARSRLSNRAEYPRVNPVACRRVVDAHGRVGVIPRAARAVAPLDHDDVRVGVGDECVGKRHPGGANDEVVGIDHTHDPVPFLQSINIKVIVDPACNTLGTRDVELKQIRVRRAS